MTAPSPAGESATATSNKASWVLGVDGGGTKTLAWVAKVDDQHSIDVAGRGVSGSSNQIAVGVELALENLANAIAQACDKANIPTSSIASATFALAGSGNSSARQAVIDYVHKRFSIPAVEIIHDGQAVLVAGTPTNWGISFIAGTGTVAFGKNQEGKTAVVGGWGYWFGDEGSAYWIGQTALRAIAQAADGRASRTNLSDKILKHLGIQQPRKILATLTERGDTRLAIANLAEIICYTAAEKDEVASSIVGQAAQHWSQHITCLAKQLSLGTAFPLSLAGGVLCENEFARNQLLAVLAAEGFAPTSVELVVEPVRGCVLMAKRLLSS